ncbi:drebrin-like a isoform X1 [Takifugu rubripes]|uniref:Drebrin-like a n=1 Tax=Takifugu rubripes TaxID=31033 RepID=H2VET1_TAKRU|nr:drebrin-like protein A isoform X1 [Takifugu rubripes]
MAVNLSRNGSELMAAYEEVVDSRSNTNWALFTYEGNSNDIRLAEKGDGGLEELVEELNSGKVMYAFCRVEDPNSGLPKYVLINWTGEGVKDSRKGACANHVSSMANFLKGAHVTINARGEDDVEPETILEKVAKASGGNFSFHKQTQEHRDTPAGPVGSVYRKVNAVEEIQQTKKDDFWVQTQREEEAHRREQAKQVEQERQRLERERRELDEKETKERQRREKERAQQIEQAKLYQKKAEEEERERAQQHRNEEGNKNQKKGISFAPSVQKANEAKSLISQRSFNPRDVFKQRERSFEANASTSAAPSRPGKLQSPFLSQKGTPQQPPAAAASVTPMSPASPPPSPLQLYAHPTVVTPTPPESTSSPVPAANIYTEEEEWSDEFDDDAEEATPETTGVVKERYEVPVPAVEEDLYENVSEYTSPDEHNQTNGQQISAKALYDYQAVDDTEITFDPDDIITGIEMLDEGWWRGYGPDGHFGMFPANYVELL